MTNEEILSLNSGKKFDIVLMNPPYGADKYLGDRYLHFKFVNKCLEIANTQIVVMPFRIIISTSDKYDQFRKIYDNHLESVEQVDSSKFPNTNMPDVGIYHFNTHKQNDDIKITYKNDETLNVKSLLDISPFTPYEKNIKEFIYTETPNYNAFRCSGSNEKSMVKELFEKYIKSHFKDNKKIYLTTTLANGSMNGKWITSNVGKIFKSINTLKQNIIDRKGAGTNIMVFNSVKEAENCLAAIKRPLLRFALYRIQDDQNMREKCYKYIPRIDWSDPRTTTDEGLLELCGCSKEKCKEYADYCKEVIDKVDNK